jgi:hypothetical protein
MSAIDNTLERIVVIWMAQYCQPTTHAAQLSSHLSRGEGFASSFCAVDRRGGTPGHIIS